jgi:lysyl endopeptidase
MTLYSHSCTNTFRETTDKTHRLYIILILFLLSSTIKAQIEYPGKPKGPSFDGSKGVTFYKILPDQLQQNNINNESSSSLKIDNFASLIDINLSPVNCGTWDTLPDKSTIWRLGITSERASSLSLIFDTFHIAPGCKLIVYSPLLKETYGAFTFRNNNDVDILAITPVNDDSLIIELQLLPIAKNFGFLVLGQVGVGRPVVGISKSTADKWYKASQPCEVDVRCDKKQEIQNQKHSVCRVVIHGSRRCTGTLLNNTSNNGRALFLTAGHCIKTASDAATSLFYFDYESPYCGGPDGPIKSLSGSKLLSRDTGLDFALLELNERPPLDYNPLYSGWNVTEDTFHHTYTYRHPEGDVKKISENNNLVLNGDYNSFDSSQGFDSNVHWLVQEYEIGSTEQGSSGSALFDNNFRVRGTLSGGAPACIYEINDFYEKLSHSWNDRSDITHQLKHWLDPLNSDSLSCGNYDPAGNLFKNGQILSNIDSTEEKINMRVEPGWGLVSGQNSIGSTDYAEYFHRNGTKYVYALNVDIANDFPANDSSRVVFKVWKGSEYPEELIFSKEFLLFELNKGEENFIRLDTALKVDKDFFVGYEVFYPEPLDSFSVLIAKPRGENNRNTAFAKTGGIWQRLTDGKTILNTSLAIRPLVFDFVPTKNSDDWKLPTAELTLYPNPARDIIQVLFNKKPEGTIVLTVIDLYGKQISSLPVESPEVNFPFEINNLQGGFYILKVDYPGGTINKKFIKL